MLKRNTLRHFYLSTFLHDLGWKMLAIFTLFYFYQLGWSLPVLIVFMLITVIAESLFAHALANLLLIKYRISVVMTFANFLRIGYIALILFLGGPSAWGYVLFFSVGIVGGLSNRLYAVSWEVYFIEKYQEGKLGGQVAITRILGAIVGFLAPLMSGLMAQAWGFPISLTISSIVSLISIVPLLFIEGGDKINNRNLELFNLHFGQYWKIFKETYKHPLVATLASDSIFYVLMPLWALYLMVVVFVENTYSGIGIVAATSALVTIIFAKITGYYVDKRRPEIILKISASAELVLGAFRPFVTTVPLAFAHNILHQASTAHGAATSDWYFSLARRNGQTGRMLAFLQMYNLTSQIFQALLLLIALILLLVFKQPPIDILGIYCACLGFLGLIIFSFRRP